MVPIVPYVQLEEDAELAELHQEITGLRGQLLNLHRVLANCPAALRAFMVMSRHVRDESTLPNDLRELAILTVAHNLENSYEIHQHEPIALRVGLRPEQLASLSTSSASQHLTDLEGAVVSFAREATEDRHVTPSTSARLATFLTPEQIVELALTVGWYHLCHVLIDSLGVEIEPR
jgi:alkylhydroperoxidase family enzyme